MRDCIIVIRMKSLMAGVAGILIACTIFAATFLQPWISTDAANSSSSLRTIPPASPVTIHLGISNFTEPQGLGSHANISVVIRSETNISNVIISLAIVEGWGWQLKGIEFDGSTADAFWTGNLTASSPIEFSARVNAKEIGCGQVEAWVKWNGSQNYQPSWDLLGIAVYEDQILVFEDFHGTVPLPLPPGWPPGLNMTWLIPYNITIPIPPYP
jgi:hypothetical protein